MGHQLGVNADPRLLCVEPYIGNVAWKERKVDVLTINLVLN